MPISEVIRGKKMKDQEKNNVVSTCWVMGRFGKTMVTVEPVIYLVKPCGDTTICKEFSNVFEAKKFICDHVWVEETGIFVTSRAI